jgi:hypothetical protein
VKLRIRRGTAAHQPNCPAKAAVLNGSWNSAWYVDRGFKWLPHGTGQSGPWIELRCNAAASDPCPARLYVHSDDIIAQVPKW